MRQDQKLFFKFLQHDLLNPPGGLFRRPGIALEFPSESLGLRAAGQALDLNVLPVAITDHFPQKRMRGGAEGSGSGSTEASAWGEAGRHR